jgi:hypothetical protein
MADDSLLHKLMNALRAILWLGAIGAAALIVTVGVAFCIAYVRARRQPPRVPPPPFKCSSCGSHDIDYVVQGMWDGIVMDDLPVGGGYSYGTCKQCGGRCARESKSYKDGRSEQRDSFVPTEEEWLSRTTDTSARH